MNDKKYIYNGITIINMKIIKRLEKKQIFTLAIWGLIVLFSILYISLIFNINMTTDEIFTMKLIGKPFGEIIDGTAADVHPPLYYFYAKLYEFIEPQNVHIQKVAVVIPMIGVLVYVATVVRKEIGDIATFMTLLFFTCVPCTMEYAVQIRMYSLAILCVTVCGFQAYLAYTYNKKCDWFFFIIGALGAAYLHYFAFVAVCFEIGFLFLALVISKKKLLKNWFLSVVIMVLGYIPWLPVFIRQVTSTRESYWIAPITLEVIWSYFTWAFDLELVGGFVYVYLIMLIVLGGVGLSYLVKGKQNAGFAFLAMFIPACTSISGVIISLSKSPIFCGRYVIVAMMMLALYFGILVSVIIDNNEALWSKLLVGVMCIVLLFSGAVQYKECFRQEYRNGYLQSTVNFFNKYLGENDYVVYNYEAMRFVYSYYFPEDRLIYVKDFDLDQEYDNLWFLSTLNEWPITDLDCQEHDLKMVYLGLYGVEGVDFDLYRIMHN